LQAQATGIGNVGVLVPGFLHENPGSHHAGEDNTPDLILGNRLDGHAEESRVRARVGLDRLNRSVANESSELVGPRVRIAQWGLKTDDTTDGHSGRRLVVNPNGGSVANVGAVSYATGKSIASNRIGGRQ
jgi:hypothetical protein